MTRRLFPQDCSALQHTACIIISRGTWPAVFPGRRCRGAVCCNAVLQCGIVAWFVFMREILFAIQHLKFVAVCCKVLICLYVWNSACHTARTTHYTTLQHTATHATNPHPHTCNDTARCRCPCVLSCLVPVRVCACVSVCERVWAGQSNT